MSEVTIQFDRKKAFEAKSWPTLHRLRVRGALRRQHFFNRSYRCERGCQSSEHWNRKCKCASDSLVALMMGHSQRERGVYVDLGCGNSADTMIAREIGHYAYGVDLIAPSDPYFLGDSHMGDFYLKGDRPLFFRADICERIPFEDGTVDYASSHAVIDLIPPNDRAKFFSEVFRILKPGGYFSFMGAKLKEGYGFSESLEKQRARACGFRYWRTYYAATFFKPNLSAQ